MFPLSNNFTTSKLSENSVKFWIKHVCFSSVFFPLFYQQSNRAKSTNDTQICILVLLCSFWSNFWAPIIPIREKIKIYAPKQTKKIQGEDMNRSWKLTWNIVFHLWWYFFSALDFIFFIPPINVKTKVNLTKIKKLKIEANWNQQINMGHLRRYWYACWWVENGFGILLNYSRIGSSPILNFD